MSVDYRPDYDPADVNSDYGHTGGNITVPTFTGDTRPFRFWCQKALPLVYDDSLSYYEVLCKMADYMNNFVTDLTTVEDSMTEFGQQFVINQQFLNSMADQLGQNVADLEAYINARMDDFMAAYTQLQTYVNNYFDNLDVQEEINAKLDEMASDGTLNDLFDPVLETWMQQKTAQIDAAIANQDTIQAAQNARISVLEGRMDTFSGLPSGSTSGNAELLDIRTNFLGETYPTAGDAVRASDMIASGFQSIGFTRLTEWDGNESDSRFDTIQIDVTAYKGGHMTVIANTYQFVNNIEEGAGIKLFGSNVAGKTVDSNAHQYPFPDGVSGIPSPVFKDFTVLTTSVQDEERILIQLAIPEDFQYQYLKLGNVAPIPGEGYSYTQPAAIVYANSWSKTQVDPTLTIAGAAADAKATGDALDELNERIDEQISEVDNLTQEVYSKNRFNPSNVESGYVNQATGEWSEGSASYSGTPEMVEVLSSPFVLTVYPYNGTANLVMRYAVYDANGVYITGAILDNSDFTIVPNPSDSGEYVGYIAFTNTNIKYIRFSMLTGFFSTVRIQIESGTIPTAWTAYTGDSTNIVGIPALESSVFGKNSKVNFLRNLLNGTTFTLGFENSLKKNKVYHLHALLANTFSSLLFGHGEDSYSLYFKIDNTNITFMTNGTEGSQLAHGLTIDTYIDLMLIVGEKNTGTIILNTFGGTYTRTVQTVNGYKGDIFIRPVGCNLKDVYIAFTSMDFRQPIWMFGDSYFTHISDARWPYWLIEWGFGRCMLNGFPGENSSEALPQVLSYIGTTGIPKFIIWCLGMNDPDNGSVNASWLSCVQTLIEECEKNNITPILATIPNVPNYVNSYKNAWVKASGYRYIDFAKAVGAEETGSSWYTGALSNDNVHPSEIGARLLCEQAILDVPELTLGNI